MTVLQNFGFVNGLFSQEELLYNLIIPKHEKEDENEADSESESESDDAESIASTTCSSVAGGAHQASSLESKRRLFNKRALLF